MSDFDEEAERERLREKYERDRQKREASERMSELLLKGATMTNAHCDTCADPIFRYDGQEFCPTCQVPKGEVGDETEVEAESADAHSEQTANGDSDADVAQEAPPEPQKDTRERPPDSETLDSQSHTYQTPEPVDESEPHEGTTVTSPGSKTVDAGGIADARAALERTLADSARRAEVAEDARSRREHLGAAKEAAEALAALRNAQ